MKELLYTMYTLRLVTKFLSFVMGMILGRIQQQKYRIF